MLSIYPYNKKIKNILKIVNEVICQYTDCTRYIELFLGTGIFFNNLVKDFDSYVLHDVYKPNLYFYKLLKNQVSEYILNECERLWNNYPVNEILDMYTNERDMYQKCLEKYILLNKYNTKNTPFEKFPESNLKQVISKLKNNDILFIYNKVMDILRKAYEDDLLFINMDNISEELHLKLINKCKMYSKAVIIIYSSIGYKYADKITYYRDIIKIDESKYIFIYNKLKLNEDW